MKKAVEAVFEGQSDKVCDQIADALVDEYLRRDQKAHVDLHVFGSHGMMMIGGEVESSADFDVSQVVKQVYREIGYDDDIEVFVNIEGRAPHIRSSLRSLVTPVVIHGFATRETRERLPRPQVFCQSVLRRMVDLRRLSPEFSWLRPDGSVQLIMDAKQVHAVTLLASHSDQIDVKEVRTALLDRVISPLIGEQGIQIFINPAGPFSMDGLRADAGASGSRNGNDLYGGLIPQGTAILCGKDPWRVERCGTLMARHAALSLVEQGLASSAFITLAYTPGKTEPIHLAVSGLTEKSRGAKVDLTNIVKKDFDFRPEAIVERLDLIRPMYRDMSVFGPFGRDGFAWEKVSIKKEGTKNDNLL